jgi:energy-coupling factor transporter ATP-binding protein EcfA2
MITILATGNNERGDIFTRLMSDAFHSLGYDQLRFNVHQTGREVDVIGTHCTENRMIVAECKAQADPIGGSDLNKFYGVLDAERRKTGVPTEGYFASISGFKESAIQQEKDLGNRFTLLSGKEIVSHLIRGRIIIDQSSAFCEASKWLEPTSSAKVGKIELLAHDSGWHWLVTFANPGGVISGYSIVHADGYVLDRERGAQLVKSLAYLTGLEYVGPDEQEPNSSVNEARARYIEYLIKEYGYITLEGLPADQEVGSRSLRLENIFVPLSLERVKPEVDGEDLPAEDLERDKNLTTPELEGFERAPAMNNREKSREVVGKVLASNDRLALLGSPGSGKTTLLKRLAVAYAAPERRAASGDLLPDRDWFPIVIRCRHLGADVSRPLLKGIEGLTERAEMPELGQAFRDCVTRELRAGRVLLLVDGLDEISSPTERSAFVAQLRTFLGTYPSASLVVTSREFGFRTVAGAVASLCTMYRVAELSNSDVQTITLAWHREVVGSSAAVTANARKLADSILRTDRVRRLAVNPLLLTTLLLVRRWLGELPRKRSVLYAKAIEVLLMTWNVEGHQPLDPDEALPQLAFAAFCMMQRNVQSVSIRELTEYFNEARRQMPELLGYSRISVSEFVSRVEERSSLLSLSGHVLEDGQLRATYEFKHLTFQEYLAALAAAQGFYPDRREGEQLVEVLEPYIAKASWREVLPLAGVLGGRSSSALIERIIELIGPKKRFTDVIVEPSMTHGKSLVALLARCLADDVPLSPETLGRAIEMVLTQAGHTPLEEVLDGRYASEFYRIARAGYERFDEFAVFYGSGLALAKQVELGDPEDDVAGFFDADLALIKSSDPIERAEGSLAAMRAAFNCRNRPLAAENWPVTPLTSAFARVKTTICRMLDNESDPRVLLANFWALCWLTEIRKPTPAQTARLLPRLWQIWQTSSDPIVQRQCAWTIWVLPRLERGKISLERGPSSEDFLKGELNSESWLKEDRYQAALTIGYYLQAPWTDRKLVEILRSSNKDEGHLGKISAAWRYKFLMSLGPRGVAAARAEQQQARREREVRKAPQARRLG